MIAAEITQKIAQKDVDVDRFVQLAVREETIRDEIINQMLTNPNIMVYYHCYYVVSKASQARPELFYQYWHAIAALLEHKNSYHRDIALTVIANLTQVDQANLFSEIFDGYFEHIHDKKFMTGQCCVRNSLKIIRNKPELKDRIVALLLNVDTLVAYPEKQTALLKCDVLEVLAETYAQEPLNQAVEGFIQAAAGSLSPKTRNKAKELIKRFDL
jgi:hypothetical protein